MRCDLSWNNMTYENEIEIKKQATKNQHQKANILNKKQQFRTKNSIGMIVVNEFDFACGSSEGKWKMKFDARDITAT